jgi:hypothetical protein
MSRIERAVYIFAMRYCPFVFPCIAMPNSSSCRPAHAIHLRLRTAVEAPAVPWIEPPLCLRRPDGTLELLGQSADLLPTVRFVLSYGRYATLLGSPALQRAVVEEARRVLGQYDQRTKENARCNCCGQAIPMRSD